MKKMNLKKRMLEAFNAASTNQSSTSTTSNGRKNYDFRENLQPEQFQVCKVVRHGFPNRPTAIAFDPVQNLLAVGSYSGSIRIFGQPGVDCQVNHDNDSSVIKLLFLVNEGALVSVCADDTIHLWNLRQKKPAILHSLKFNRERITCCHVPYQSKWIYVGTDKGNTHLCNVESFKLSGYCVSWNKAIELSQKSHPGQVVSISENPVDENRILIGFQSGFIALWDLKLRVAEHRYTCTTGIQCLRWHHEGKQFMVCCEDGSINVFNSRSNTKQTQYPHAKTSATSDKPEQCRPIDQVEWLSCRNSEDFVIFSGGLPCDPSFPPRPTLTVMRGRSVTVLEMDFPIVDFVACTETPWKSDFQDPTALIILLEKELIAVDLETPGYPCIDVPHAMDIHDSPVTCLKYVPDQSTDLIPGLYQVSAAKNRRQEFSKKEWPIMGGEGGLDDADAFPEIIVTGHADGSVRFWDASTVSLKSLYKLRTYKIFKREADDLVSEEEDPFQITQIHLCPESRTLAVANASSCVMLFKLNTQEQVYEIPTITIPNVHDLISPIGSPLTEIEGNLNCHFNNTSNIHGENKQDGLESQQSLNDEKNETKSEENDSSDFSTSPPETQSILRVKNGAIKQSAGFQIDFVCLLLGAKSDPYPTVTFLSFNTSYDVLAFGTSSSLCVVDIVHKTCLFNMSINDILVSIDKRIQPRSPTRPKPSLALGEISQSSFSFDQGNLKSPSGVETKAGRDPKSKWGAAAQKTRGTTRKSLGDFFAIAQTAQRRKLSIFARSASLSIPEAPEIRLHPSMTVPSPLHGVNAGIPLSPGDDSAFEDDARNGDADVLTFEAKPEHWNGGSNAQNLHPHSQGVQGSSAGSRVPRGESTSSSQSSNSAGAKMKKAPSRLHKKPSSFSFEKSLDSTTSFDGDSPFSRASSLSETDRVESDITTFLAFAHTYTRKNDSLLQACLWAGTSGGYIFNIVLNLPSGEQRSSQPVMVSPSGTLLQMKSSVVSISFLNSMGRVISARTGNWREQSSLDDHSETDGQKGNNHSNIDKQFLVACSEKQVKVFTLPSFTCIHAHNFSEVTSVMHTTVEVTNNGAYLACYSAHGNIIILGLTSLNLLMDSAYLPPHNVRVSQTFSFTSNGQAIYLVTPSELQRISYLVESYENIQEIRGHLFIPCEVPDRPNPGFFKGLFGGGHASLDREELFGEVQSGKASRGVAKLIPGTGGASLEGLRATSTGLASEMQKLKMQAQERGEKLGELADKTAQMKDSASKFSSDAHALMLKYKNKKWYQM